MALVIVGSATGDATNANPKSVTTPTGSASGNVVFAFQYSASATTLNSGDGFADIITDTTDNGGNHIRISYLVFSGAPAGSYSFQMGGVANIGSLATYSGQNATPYEQQSIVTSAGAAPNSVTPTYDNSIQILCYGTDANTTVATAPSGNGGTYSLLYFGQSASFGSIAIYAREFGAGTGGSPQGAPSTALAWTAGTTRHSATFVIVPASTEVPLNMFGQACL